MILDTFRLDGKVALVGGASRGIGQGLARALFEAGAAVMLVARSEAPMREFAQEMDPGGDRTLVAPADLASIPEIDRVVGATVQQFGRIDIVIHLAGINLRGPSLEYTEEAWDQVLNLDLKSPFFLAQRAARVMAKQGGGKIIFIASMLSEVGVPNIVAYAASKGGIRSMVKSLAVEWAAYNINVNALGPGYILTELTRPLYENAERNRRIMDHLAFKRWGTPQDLTGACLFLASPASDYMTGQIVYVDGGYLAD